MTPVRPPQIGAPLVTNAPDLLALVDVHAVALEGLVALPRGNRGWGRRGEGLQLETGLTHAP